jgi:transposase InsO family protein
VRWLSETTELARVLILKWIGLAPGKFYDWAKRYGLANEHNCAIPRDFWLEDWEKQAIVAFFDRHPLEGYRRLAFMMLDANLAAASPATVYRVLKAAGRLDRVQQGVSKKGKGFVQPLQPHEHWHTDIHYVKVLQTHYFLGTVLDGASRAILALCLLAKMLEADVELLVQRARERFPGERPRLISDNGSQYVAEEFANFIRLVGMTHVRTSPYYPQSNGKQERFYRSLEEEALAGKYPDNPSAALAIVTKYVDYYNHVRLHSAIGYVTPWDFLQGKAKEIQALRDQRLEQARDRRRLRRQAQSAGARADAA